MNKSTFNLVDLIAKPCPNQLIPKRVRPPTFQRPLQPFIHMNVHLDWVTRVTRIGGKAPSVAFALLFLAGVNKADRFSLTSKVIEIACCERKALYRALSQMESEGLIAISRRQGRKPIVQLIGCGRNTKNPNHIAITSTYDSVPEV
jgi:hypothetical protein